MKDKILPDTWLFKQTFSKLTASPQIIQEVIDMTETKKTKRFILRRLVVAALVTAMVFALAMGANAATGGGLFRSIIHYTVVGDDGTSYALAIDAEALDKAGEEGAITYTFMDKDGEKTQMMYRDSEGNVVLKDVDLSDSPEEIIGRIQEEAEADKLEAADAE